MRLLIALPRTVKILYKFYSYSSTYFDFAPYAWSQMLIFFTIVWVRTSLSLNLIVKLCRHLDNNM